MPYIAQERRAALSLGDWPMNAGELNYLFTVIALRYLKTQGEKYQHYNDIVGALENCKLELYRRRTGPYEDKAIERNGDVI